MKDRKIFLWIIIAVILLYAGGFSYIFFRSRNNNTQNVDSPSKIEKVEKPLGLMMLIEYKDTVGLLNFVNEMDKRNIHGMLMVTPEFVQVNCADIKEIMKHNVEIIAANVEAPFWDMSYENQRDRIVEMREGIADCTGIKPRIISSRYFATDNTTLQIAEELGIPYITARGTTDSKATVYQPEGYETKILSISNIPIVTYKYGSLCDYSFFERGGTPDDMLAELIRSTLPLTDTEIARWGEYNRVTPVSHTNIGGYLKPWMDMWIGFWDSEKVEWVDLDTFVADVDWEIPDWQIPINKNAPYTPEKIRPLVSYDEEEKVNNPCAVEELAGEEVSTTASEYVGDRIVMYHNGTGSMCLDAIEFLETLDYESEQRLNTEGDFYNDLNALKSIYGDSDGVSTSYGYFPIIFVKDRAFSGFNEEIKAEILELTE